MENPVDRRRKAHPSVKKTAVQPPIQIISHDPEINMLQGMIGGMHHISIRHMSMRHLKLILSVHLANKGYKQPAATRQMIASIAQLRVEELDPELTELCEKKYLHEIVPTFGAIHDSYKMGPLGGTLLRHIFGSSIKPTTAAA